jgi:Rad3-related DNA helicase
LSNLSIEEEIDRAFGSKGLLSDVVVGYKARVEQSEMAQAIGAAIKKKEPIICEAGTGTGKTFAYLIPGILLRTQDHNSDRYEDTSRSTVRSRHTSGS